MKNESTVHNSVKESEITNQRFALAPCLHGKVVGFGRKNISKATFLDTKAGIIPLEVLRMDSCANGISVISNERYQECHIVCSVTHPLKSANSCCIK